MILGYPLALCSFDNGYIFKEIDKKNIKKY